jgi:ankyrin repeat protein
MNFANRMKTTLYAAGSAVLLFLAPALRSADTLTQTLQHGLFEEEANQNLDAAIKSYQSVIAQSDEQRKLVGTALFRLGECYRKLGKTNEATAQFRRILRDFSDQEQLATLSRETLGKLGVAAAAAESLAERVKTSDDAQALARYRAMVKDSPDLVNSRDAKGYTPLLTAAELGYTASVEFLIAQGADVNAQKGGAETPLHLAAANGHKRSLELLLANGSHIEAKSVGGTPLFLAVQKGYAGIVDVLLKEKADVNTIGPYNQQPLHAAARNGYVNVASTLIDHGAELEHSADSIRYDSRYISGTPLHFAASLGHANIVQLLLKHKANVNSRDPDNLTPLYRAAESGHRNIAEALLEAGADPNIPTVNGDTALFATSDSEMMRLLIDHKADVNVTNRLGYTPLGQLVKRNAPANSLELLLKSGANPNATTEGGAAPLLYPAVVNGNAPAAVALLLNYGAQPNFIINGETPLSIAKRVTENGGINQPDRLKFGQIHKLLLEHGADENYLRRSKISFTRIGWQNEITQWTQEPKGLNSYTLFELFTTLDRATLVFADFDHVEIERLAATNSTVNTLTVNFTEAMESGSCSNDVKLRWGDRVVIRERDHSLSAQWDPPDSMQDLLEKCGTRRVQIIVKGITNSVVLKPLVSAFIQPNGQRVPRKVPQNSITQGEQGERTLSVFRLKQVILEAKVLRTSSDLSNVRVRRLDPMTKVPQESKFDLTRTEPYATAGTPGGFAAVMAPRPIPQPGSPPPTYTTYGGQVVGDTASRVTPVEHDLWLRDGDIIEIPDKP